MAARGRATGQTDALNAAFTVEEVSGDYEITLGVEAAGARSSRSLTVTASCRPWLATWPAATRSSLRRESNRHRCSVSFPSP